MNRPKISVVIVSFNTRDLLRECLRTLQAAARGLSTEIFVVDNASKDGSAEMTATEFPNIHLIRSGGNIGFAAANNLAFARVKGRYVVLLNSDAFPRADALQKSVAYMDANPEVGIGGARLIGSDGSWQPSGRMFPGALLELFMISGLSARFPHSRLFGKMDRTWADQEKPADVDWVVGAYSIIRAEALQKVGPFDESFYLYYEEVDLCRRFRQAGYVIRCWPDVVVVHIGGESSKTVAHLSFSRSGSQLTLWRMRSELLFYRKHYGAQAWLVKQLEIGWHTLRSWRNSRLPGDEHALKADDSRRTVALMKQAWNDTEGGRVSPPRPW